MAQTKSSDVTIEIMENGPYIVKGLQRLVDSEEGEMEAKANIALCRCGGSANKPFCDGSHKGNGFSGKREIDKPLHKSTPYEGEEVTIHDNRRICAHAAHCINDLPSVFRKDGRPWINPDGAGSEAIATVSHKCPSGALKATRNGERIDREDDLMEITIRAAGPYEVRGGIDIQIDEELSPPEPTRYALCRCGASKNKPYCDGSHGDLDEGWDR